MRKMNKLGWSRPRKSRFFAVILLLAGSFSSQADAISKIEAYSHLGVASCATSVCHGKLSEQPDENVWLNEYRIWSSDDRHSRAYQTLLSEESKQIAAKLGLPNARGAKICLNCHADNIVAGKRGRKFQITDGIGCEACHGGAEKWIESHAEPAATHQDNLARGMYPTEDAQARAELCLSCHAGTATRFADHRIMGAGHPRLSFELEAFTANQPAHYAVDEDYRHRKGEIGGFNLWLTGQMAAARRNLQLLQSDLFELNGMFPEIAFYDCHSCHHSMDELRWSRSRLKQGIKPGTLRLQESYFVMLQAITDVLKPEDTAGLVKLTNELIQAGQQSVDAVHRSASRLDQWLATHQLLWRDTVVPVSKIRAVRKTLLSYAAKGRMRDFASAEQTFLGVESLSLYLEDSDAKADTLDALYNKVENDESYTPDGFQSAAKRALSVF